MNIEKLPETYTGIEKYIFEFVNGELLIGKRERLEEFPKEIRMAYRIIERLRRIYSFRMYFDFASKDDQNAIFDIIKSKIKKYLNKSPV